MVQPFMVYKIQRVGVPPHLIPKLLIMKRILLSLTLLSLVACGEDPRVGEFEVAYSTSKGLVKDTTNVIQEMVDLSTGKRVLYYHNNYNESKNVYKNVATVKDLKNQPLAVSPDTLLYDCQVYVMDDNGCWQLRDSSKYNK